MNDNINRKGIALEIAKANPTKLDDPNKKSAILVSITSAADIDEATEVFKLKLLQIQDQIPNEMCGINAMIVIGWD